MSIRFFKTQIFSRSTLIRLVVVLFVLFICYSQNLLVKHVWIQFVSHKWGRDEGTLYEQRLAKIRNRLPQRGIVGYASDTGHEHFYRTQYVLAPLILVRSDGPRLIIGNFSSVAARPDLLHGRPYEVIQEYEDGLALLAIKGR